MTPPFPPLPESFVLESEGRRHFVFRKDLKDDLENSAWKSCETLPVLSTDSGRAPLRLLTLPPIKSGQTSGKELVVRTLHHGGAFGKLFGTCFFSLHRVFSELKNSEKLIAAGLRTPRLAALVCTRGLCFWSALVFTERVRPGQSFLDYLRQFPQNKKSLFEALGRETLRMHEAGVYHNDFHVGNVMVQNDAPWIMDLDHSRDFGTLSDRLRIQNVLRFARSLEKARLSGAAALDEGDMALWVESYARHGSQAFREDLRSAFTAFLRRLAFRKLCWRLTGKISG